MAGRDDLADDRLRPAVLAVVDVVVGTEGVAGTAVRVRRLERVTTHHPPRHGSPPHSASKATLTSKNAPNWRPGGICKTDQNNVGLFYKMKSFGCTFLLCALRFSSWVFV